MCLCVCVNNIFIYKTISQSHEINTKKNFLSFSIFKMWIFHVMYVPMFKNVITHTHITCIFQFCNNPQNSHMSLENELKLQHELYFFFSNIRWGYVFCFCMFVPDKFLNECLHTKILLSLKVCIHKHFYIIVSVCVFGTKGKC